MNNNNNNNNGLREEIANQFDECMGYWEGIKVPDHDEGYRAIDYADKVLEIIQKQMNDLELEYKKRLIFELDYKVVFEDIRDIIQGKTYKEIFYAGDIDEP